MAKKNLTFNGVEVGAKANNVDFDTNGNGMHAENVQEAIEEVKVLASRGGGSAANAYNGKRMGIIGDSFTEPGLWPKQMNKTLNLVEYKNTARSGGSWVADTVHEELSALKRAQVLYEYYNAQGTQPDYIVVVDGVNDYGNNVPLGNIVYSDVPDLTGMTDEQILTALDNLYDFDTFSGGAQAALVYLRTRFPDAIIKIGWTPSGQQYLRNAITNHGSFDTLLAYVERLKVLALMNGVQYIDTFNCGIAPWMASERAKYQKGTYDEHPTDILGQQRIGDYMARLLLSNI